MSNTEYTLVFGLGPKADGTPNTDVDIAIAIAALEDASRHNHIADRHDQAKGA